jgi:hypothetical protein
LKITVQQGRYGIWNSMPPLGVECSVGCCRF